MSTLKICTHDRTHWLTDIEKIILVRSFTVEHFDDPIVDASGAVSHAIVRGNDVHSTMVVDFQAPDPDHKVRGDDVGNALLVWRKGDTFPQMIVAPSRSCFLLSDTGKTVDRI